MAILVMQFSARNNGQQLCKRTIKKTLRTLSNAYFIGHDPGTHGSDYTINLNIEPLKGECPRPTMNGIVRDMKTQLGSGTKIKAWEASGRLNNAPIL